jgi:hypothetical protein
MIQFCLIVKRIFKAIASDVRKGGLNPPNTSKLRPPAPKGSGGKVNECLRHESC